jgi:hypothetical protein
VTTVDYSRPAATALRLLARFGAAVTLSTTVAAATTSRRTVNAVFVDRVRHTLDTSGVEIGDWRVLLEAAAAPRETDRLVRGAEAFVVVRVEPIQPGATVVAWWAWARAG